MTEKNMSMQAVEKYISEMPDEVLASLQFSVPWQYADTVSDRDEDGFLIKQGDQKDDTAGLRSELQEECFKKFHRNPHVNTAVRGLVGRLTGFGAETTSEIFEIQQCIEEIELDPRNRLWYFWPKWVGRFNIEGELFLLLTLHVDGFVEVDFIDPAVIEGGGDDGSGIVFHPSKPQMPLFYLINKNGMKKQAIPSIFVGRYPKIAGLAEKSKDFNLRLASRSRDRRKIFKKLGGYRRFIIANDKGLVTKRAVSYLRTTLEWLNHYENLKKYEIDHKRSSGAYAWVFSFDDVRAFKTWLSLTDDEKRKTAVGAKMTPGGKLVLPPGMSVEAKNPNLTSIKEQDTDILHMIAGGLNEPEDILTGAPRGPFSSVKASRGPMTDRTSDEVAYWERWVKHEFWSSIFFLKAAIGQMKPVFKVQEAVDFDNNQEPIFRNVPRKPEMLIEMSFPVSEAQAYEERARALLGVKHGPLSESLGIPNREVARRLGFGGYGRGRLRKATEEKRYPELAYEAGVDAESQQEIVEGEKGKPETGANKGTKTEPKKKTLIKRKKQ